MDFCNRINGKALARDCEDNSGKKPGRRSAASGIGKYTGYFLLGVATLQAPAIPNRVFASMFFGGAPISGRRADQPKLDVSFRGGMMVVAGTAHTLFIEGDLTGHGNAGLSDADLAMRPIYATYKGNSCAYFQFKRGVLLVYGDSNTINVKAITTENDVFTSESSRRVSGNGAVFTSPDGILSFVPGNEQLVQTPGINFRGATARLGTDGKFIISDSSLGSRAIAISISTGEPEYVASARETH